MAVTRPQVQGEVVGISDQEAGDLILVATAEVDAYLNGGTCPEALRDHAIRRVIRFLYTTGGEAGGRVEVDGVKVFGPGVGDPMHRSGAQQLLARFRRRRVTVVRGNAEVTT